MTSSFDMSELKKGMTGLHQEECDSDCMSTFDLPLPVLKRLHVLKSLQATRASVATEFQKELLNLERKFQAKYSPIWEERRKIVAGDREPAEKELAGFSETGIEEVESSPNDTKGIPNFWATALMNHPELAGLMGEGDADALSHLVDVRVAYFPDEPGFRIDFEFTENEFFNNKVLTKEYHLLISDDLHQDELMYDYAKGTPIDWKDGKNLCFRTIVRTQRHRTKNTVRNIKREEPIPSFFHFFMPPTIPEDAEDDSDDAEDFEGRLEMDYSVGLIIKEQIVPFAVDWFTGEALDYADLDGFEEGSDQEEGDDDHDEEESDEEVSSTQKTPMANEAKPECKQQ